MPDIFISYSRKDSEQATVLAERLRSDGIDVWIDQHGIDAAASWSKEIVRAIDDSKAFLVLLSQSSLTSKNVARELGIASEAEKPILPVALEDVRLTDEFRYHLSGIQRVAYTQFDAISKALHGFGIEPREAHTGMPVPRKSLMVLPFEDLSPTHDNQWFADGIVSELIGSLSNVKAIQLADSQATKEFRSYRGQLSVYAGEMGIRYFVQGDVRKFGNDIKISTRLLDIETGDHLWQDTMKGTMDDVFDIQERVAQNVVDGLKIHLGQSEEERLRIRGTENAEAYELSLRSNEYFNRQTRAGLTMALQQLERAIELDPRFASALRQRAYTLVAMHDLYDPDPALLDEAEALAKRALELEPEQSLTSHVLALAHLGRGQNAEAERVAADSVGRNPENSTSHFSLGFIYAQQRRPELAIPHFERSLELDPNDHTKLWNMVHMCDLVRDTARVERWAKAAIPVFERHLRLIPDNEHVRGLYAHILYLAGEIDRSREVIRSLADQPDLDIHTLYNVACLAARSGNAELAMDLLRRAVKKGYRNIETVRHDPDLGSLHGTPDFEQLMKELEATHA